MGAYLLNIPNIISIGRLLAVPVIVWMLLRQFHLAAFYAFVVAGLSDAVDGFIARRFNARSRLGRYLDPIADKVMLVSVFVTLGIAGMLPSWLVILVVSRDVLIIGGVLLSYTLSVPVTINPIFISKANTTAQITLVAVILGQKAFAIEGNAIIWLDTALIVLTALTTILSGIAYLIGWWRQLTAAEMSS